MPRGRRFERLAIRAPEGDARVESLPARLDGSAAAAARFATPAVDPKILLTIGAPRGSSDPRVRHDFVAGIVRNVGNQKFASCGRETGKFRNVQ